MSRTSIPAKRHVVVLHRWRDSYAHYEDYLDHTEHHVTYVTTEVGLDGVPAGAAATATVARTDDLSEVADAVESLSHRFGRPSAVVALKEDDLEVAATLRTRYGCPGPAPEAVEVFRDKLLMCSAVARSRVAVPAFARVDDTAGVLRFAADHGWPVILKPRTSSSSEGIVRLDSADDVRALSAGPDGASGLFGSRSWMVQSYVDAPIYHVDGAFDGRDLGPWRVSRYLDSCLDFRGGGTLGSVEDDDPRTAAAVHEATRDALRALTSEPVVFHLELFVEDVETGAESLPRCTFLEVGARVGGAEIPFVWRDVHGLDLMKVAFELQLGAEPSLDDATGPGAADGGEVAGWLLVSAPAQRPCRITRSASMVGRVPGPYAESVLAVGDVLPAADAFYEHVGGRFRFRGESGPAVQRAIEATAASFRVEGSALVPEDAPATAVLSGVASL